VALDPRTRAPKLSRQKNGNKEQEEEEDGADEYQDDQNQSLRESNVIKMSSLSFARFYSIIYNCQLIQGVIYYIFSKKFSWS
jgi:hypothetical protein